jgi:hypothetical protein
MKKTLKKTVYTRKELWYPDLNAIIPQDPREGVA